MLIKKIKKIKGFSVLIVPDDGSHGTRTKKLTPAKVISIIAFFSVVIFIISGLIFAYTPLSDLFITSTSLSRADLNRMEELNNKMIFLTKELESLKSTNERLRYAIMLGDSTLIDSLQKNKEADGDNKLDKSGGNLFAVVRDLFFGISDTTKRKGPYVFNSKFKEETLYYFYNPVNGFISREFNPERGHFGVDYVLKSGTPVYAAAGGYVIFADYTTKDGNMIIINHSNDYISIYKHCSSLIKREREIVVQGDLIALSGNTGGESFGPHLHFELWKNGKPINPKENLIK